MCGRIANGTKPGYLREQFDEVAAADILEEPGLLPRYNVTPGQYLPGILLREGEELEWAILRWGLIPRWAKPDNIPDRTFNARSETVAEKPTFRNPYKKRRCVIPVSGYFEWTGVKGAKQPYYFYNRNQSPILMAGLWEKWNYEDNSVESCTILTKAADDKMGKYHHRMPVFLDNEHIRDWIEGSPEAVPLLIHQANAEPLDVHPVSKEVNSGRIDHPGLIEQLNTLL
ncbi:MAG: SOS response-associated peptidase [Rhodothermales bacterium]|mgnify:CR=1 FL=1|nr:SOS response-associated peptidase [Rhodothermales bacterium]MDG2015486.1 SOS response-associated peptidase [Rhodothermales bacterium]HAY35511.1 DUF159 family protein [Bacteroidota bacterium]